MSTAQIDKFVVKGLDADIAADLVAAGMYTPQLIKAASVEDLEEAVGSENVAAVESLFGIQREA